MASCNSSDSEDLLSEAHEAVAALLKDPGSAEFNDKDAQIYPTEGLVCGGTVNAKNSFGGYVGAQTYFFERGKGGVIGELTDSTAALEISGRCLDALGKRLKQESTAKPAG